MAEPLAPLGDVDTRKMWSVDRSWGQYRGNADGNLAPSEYTKHHLDRGNTTAKCSPRILLNSLGGDRPTGTVDEMEAELPSFICRRCVPKRTDRGTGA